MAEKQELKKYLRNNTSLKDMLMSREFHDRLQRLADSSLVHYGFKKIPIKFIWDDSENADVAYINDRECVINLNSRLDEGLSYKERKSLAIGKLTHEVFGHGLYTDFSISNSLFEKFKEGYFPLTSYFQKTSNYSQTVIDEIIDLTVKCPDGFAQIFFNLQNIVEDPTIEYWALQKYPGLKKHVDFLVSRLVRDLRNVTSKQKEYDIFGAILMQARNCADMSVVSKFPVLKKTQTVFDNIETYYTFEDRIIATCYVINEIWDEHLKPLMNNFIQDQQMLNEFIDFLNELQKASTNMNQQRTQNGQDSDNQSNNSNSSQKNNPTQSSSQMKPKVSNQTGNQKDKNKSPSSNKSNKDGDENNNPVGQNGNTGSNADDESSFSDENDTVIQDNDSSGDEEHENALNVDQKDIFGNSNSDTDNHNDNTQSSKRYFHNDDEELSTQTGNNDTNVADEDLTREFDKLAEESTSEFIDRMTAEKLQKDFDAVNKQYEADMVKKEIQGNYYHKDFPYNILPHEVANQKLYNLYCEQNILRSIANNLSRKIIKAIKTRQKGNMLYEQDEGEMIDLNAYANGSDKCFMSMQHPNKKPLMACSVMVDQSGSMSGDRIRAAINASIVLEAFCRQLKIPVHIYGHSDSGGVKIRNYIEHSDAATPSRAYALASMGTYGCNRDGFAIRYGVAKLCKRPEKTKLLFIISDGSPNSTGYGHHQAIADVQDIKKICKKNNITLIPVAIGDDIQNLTEIYGNILVDARNLNDLPKNLTNMLLRELKRVI